MEIAVKKNVDSRKLKRMLPKIKALKNTLSNKNATGGGQQQVQQQTLTMCGTCY